MEKQRSRHTLARTERLKSRKAIGGLFVGGHTLRAYPLRMVWRASEGIAADSDGAPARVAFAVPKRHFRHAVQRNRIKRRMREAWRLRKSVWYERLNRQGLRVDMMLMYSGKEAADFAVIASALEQLLKRFLTT